MQINSGDQISQVYRMNNDTSAVVSTHSSDTTKGQAADKLTLSEAGRNAGNKWQEIANQYDPTNISYNELTSMSFNLQESGLITPAEGLAMRAPPSRDFNPNEKYDTLALARQAVEFDNSLGATQDKSAQLRVRVLEVLETLHNSGKWGG